MNAKNIMLHTLLSVHDAKFTIPVYQRPYSWNKEQCKRFIQDIESLIKNQESNHFLGTVIYIANDVVATATQTKEYMIIDGQQRVTTSILFLKALYDLMPDGKEKSLLFENNLVINRFDIEPKLVSIGNDYVALKNLISDNFSEIEKSKSKVIENFKEIKSLIESSKDLSLEDFLNGFKKLSIVEIVLEREKDNPQTIFESINATGLDLKESDLIRNFILMDKKLEEQKRLYEKYWFVIEENILNTNMSAFIRDYLIIKLHRTPKEKDVFKEFKAFANKKTNLSLEELLQELLNYSEIYKKIIFEDDDTLIEDRGLNQIRTLNYKVIYPVILELYKEYKEKKFSKTVFIELFNIFESFLVRRFLTDKKSSVLNGIFPNLLRSTKNIINFSYEQYPQFIAFALTKYFPTTEEFEESLFSKDIYTRKTKFTKYFLGKIENSGKEKSILDDLQIEHIMPQTLTPKWREDLGEKYQLIHSQYLHTLGNLTLTGYNQKYKNKPFTEKLKLIEEFSSLNLNKTFIYYDKWTEIEIQKRAKELIQKASNIWAKPEIDGNIVPLVSKKNNEYTLSDEVTVTSQKPKYIKFLGENIQVSTWRDFFVEFLIICINLDSDKFELLAKDPELKLKKYRIISKNKDEIDEIDGNEYEITEGIFIKRNSDAQSILNYTKIIFDKFEFIDDDLIFALSE